MFIPKRKQYHGPREKPCRVFVRFLHVSCKKPTLSCDLLKSARSLDLLTTQARPWILAFPPKKAKHGIFLQQRKSPAFTGVKYRVSLPRSPQREEPAQGLHTKAVPVAEPSRRRKRFPYTLLLLHGTGRLTKKKKKKSKALEDDVQLARDDDLHVRAVPAREGTASHPPHTGPSF